MFGNPAGGSGALNFQQIEETALNTVELGCATISRPVELILRPWHGTRYFSVSVIFLSSLMMILLPVFSVLISGFESMIPFARVPRPIGLFGIDSLSKLYFLLTFIHSVRLYRRMFDLSKEKISTFEGPPLPFFYLVPKGSSFWFCRIVLEPALLLIASIMLSRIFIIQSGLATYLQIACLALAMKNFIEWYRAWQYLRNIMDMRFAGPIIAKLSDNQASEEDLSTIHLASFPKNLDPHIRAEAVAHIARAFSPGGDTAH